MSENRWISKLSPFRDLFWFHSIPADYAITQMEALTILCHYCLLDSAQPFNQPLHGTTTSTAVPSQIFNNLVHVFIPSPVTVS